MTPPTVVAATHADLTSLVELAARTFPLACPPGTTDEDIAQFLAQNLAAPSFTSYLSDPNRKIWVVRAYQDLIGYAMTVFGPITDPEVTSVLSQDPELELSKLYLDATVHSSGAATAMMTAVIADAREQGRSRIWLGVNQLNVRAQRFYTKQGFARVGIKHFVVGAQRHSDFIMARELDS